MNRTKVRNYQILDLLGQGGMGQVYLARDLKTRAIVALKFLSPSVSFQSGGLDRFRREHELLEKLDHPNIVRVLSPIQEFEGLRYFVTEYVPGRDLQSMVQEQGPLRLPLAAEILRQALDALRAVHGRGILHCDLKPANLLIDASLTAKIGDFGIARGGGTATLTSPGDILGSPPYLAPEIWQGRGSGVRSDLYALGAVFFFAVIGRPPFDGSTAPEIMKLHLEAPVPDVTVPGWTADYDAFLRRSLEKDPARRFADAGEMLEALRPLASASPRDPGYEKGIVEILERETRTFRAREGIGRRGWLRIAAPAAAAALGLGGFLAWRTATGPRVVVVLRNGGEVSGATLTIVGETVDVETAQGRRSIPLSDVLQIRHE